MPLITAAELAALPDAIVLDARMGPDAAARFAASHIRGSRHVDVNADLSDLSISPEQGGRHPLPSPAAFVARAAAWGIGPESRVVLVDDQGGMLAAARAWWMLRAVGVRGARVLDGGVQAAPGLTSSAPDAVQPPAREPWAAPHTWPDAVSLAEVQAALAAGELLYDARPGPRFRGEEEPYDPVAGHIPGAVNRPCAANLAEDGTFLPPATLRALYAGGGIASCGSGITACHTALAMEVAGLPSPRLFTGSWSQWCRAHLPVATGP